MDERFTPIEIETTPRQIPETHKGEMYADSELGRMIDAQEESSGQRAALFTDIDDTFYLPGDKEASFDLFNEARALNYPVIPATGNQIQVVTVRIANRDLPLFQAICSSVGSQIWVLKTTKNGESQYLQDMKYREKVLATGFNRKNVVTEAKKEIEETAVRKPDLQLSFQWTKEEENFLNGEPYLENQEFKVSLQFQCDFEEMAIIKRRFESIFPKYKVSVCQISKKDGENTSLFYMDILAADKADAINYLCDELSIDTGIVAGDSGNDIAMLSETDPKLTSVLVGSHKPEALEKITEITSAPEVTGKGSIKRVPVADETKLFYIERKALKGPHSLRRAAAILRRGVNIARIKQENLNSETEDRT